ncbi:MULTISPECIES: hypothetical protein [unclassified Caulobacter]|uniref:hypothetical protein n=1 Tax=unclassified Caulobacter TaxID=2648921 RepID=UPI000D360485|nr:MULTISPECIES: hypothetical protein [unclassified Caulobacter]PTS90172.1 hypothetical protein DBR21_04715 [Caulobacter sp. HMWF009]PTT10252.1 hypothetical protein DBR10_05835 [Caulobacter sp. HMWF025]
MRILLIAGLTLAAVTSAQADEARKPLILSRADSNRDGVVSQDETAAVLVRTSGVGELAVPRPRAAVAEPEFDATEPGPLDMARRIVPASEFELANEDRFIREVRRRR